jgi:WhiB family redox-sensing transcriptional regulator
MASECEPPVIPALTVQIQSAGRLRLIGELDLATRGLVDAVMPELTAAELLVDVRELRFADAAGLSVLAAEDARRRAAQGRVLLVATSPFLRQVLRAADLSRLLPWHSNHGGDDRWRAKASCRDMPTQLFFDQSLDSELAAKELCFQCPVAGACLAYALRTDQQTGVWGGLTAAERATLTRPALGRPRTPEGSNEECVAGL